MESKISSFFAVATLCFLTTCAEDSVGSGPVTADTGGSTDEDTSSADDSATVDTGTVPEMDTGPGPMIDAPFEGGGMVANPECDLNGRWLVSQRVLATALNQDQASHNWFYFEIKQDGENVTITKGLHCGYEVTKVTSLGANVQCTAAWPGILEKCSSTGRKGTYKLVGNECAFTLGKEFVVRGATVSAYIDGVTALPADQAMGATPGWEDWDGDSQKGITMNVSGSVTGKIYVVQRDWTQYAGNTPKSATKFKIPVTWNAEQKILGTTSPLLNTASQPKSDASQHYAWMHKLTADQATGTDAEICAKVRTLKNTLVPEANQ